LRGRLPVQAQEQEGNTAMPSSIADQFIRYINDEDAEALAGLFTEDAVVVDAGRTFEGVDAIRHWADTDIFAVHVRMQPVKSITRDGETILTTRVDGEFDKTGLPDPLYIAQGITESNGRIVRLECALAADVAASA